MCVGAVALRNQYGLSRSCVEWQQGHSLCPAPYSRTLIRRYSSPGFAPYKSKASGAGFVPAGLQRSRAHLSVAYKARFDVLVAVARCTANSVDAEFSTFCVPGPIGARIPKSSRQFSNVPLLPFDLLNPSVEILIQNWS